MVAWNNFTALPFSPVCGHRIAATQQSKELPMRSIIYIIGLIVVVFAVLSLLGLA